MQYRAGREEDYVCYGFPAKTDLRPVTPYFIKLNFTVRHGVANECIPPHILEGNARLLLRFGTVLFEPELDAGVANGKMVLLLKNNACFLPPFPATHAAKKYPVEIGSFHLPDKFEATHPSQFIPIKMVCHKLGIIFANARSGWPETNLNLTLPITLAVVQAPLFKCLQGPVSALELRDLALRKQFRHHDSGKCKVG